MTTRTAAALVCLLLAPAVPASNAQSESAKTVAPGVPIALAQSEPAKLAAPARTDRIDLTLHKTWRVAGHSLEYNIEAREVPVGDTGTGATGTLFAVTYLRTGAASERARPVIFFLNGGPGAASSVLHLSGLGPKRIPEAPPGQWPTDGVEDSPYSLLDVADLVFIDAMGTGYSRLLPGGKPEDYYGTTADARSLAEFIRNWLGQHQRWTSPKYILGESYGSFRAPLIADALTGGMDSGQWHGVQLDGLILAGTVLDLTQVDDNPGNDLPFVLRLPTMAATAWHHHKAGQNQELSEFLTRARDFANDTYLPALNRGDQLAAPQREAVARQLAEFTGLSSAYVLDHNLRITAENFAHELLADRKQILGQYDTRETMPVPTSRGFSSMADPASAARSAQRSAALNDYLSRLLGIEGRSYSEVNYTIAPQWHWTGRFAGAYWNSAPYLTDLMVQNPRMRVLVTAGYFDLVTPFFGAERSLSHVGLPSERIRFRYYESGHAPYVGEANLKQIAADIRSFLADRGPAS